jgi:hypothetical protein
MREDRVGQLRADAARPALAGLGPAFSGLDFFEKSCSRSSSICAEIQRENHRLREKYEELGLQFFWQCRSTPKTSNLWIKTTNNSTNQEIKIRGNFGAIFWIFKIYGGNHNTRVNLWQP